MGHCTPSFRLLDGIFFRRGICIHGRLCDPFSGYLVSPQIKDGRWRGNEKKPDAHSLDDSPKETPGANQCHPCGKAISQHDSKQTQEHSKMQKHGKDNKIGKSFVAFWKKDPFHEMMNEKGPQTQIPAKVQIRLIHLSTMTSLPNR